MRGMYDEHFGQLLNLLHMFFSCFLLFLYYVLLLYVSTGDLRSSLIGGAARGRYVLTSVMQWRIQKFRLGGPRLSWCILASKDEIWWQQL